MLSAQILILVCIDSLEDLGSHDQRWNQGSIVTALALADLHPERPAKGFIYEHDFIGVLTGFIWWLLWLGRHLKLLLGLYAWLSSEKDDVF